MVDDTDVVGLIRESSELIALKVMVMVGHCVGEATDDGFGDVYDTKRLISYVDWSRVLVPPLFFGCLDLE